MSDAARPYWPAYVLSVLVAGAGHWYLGKWRRGFAWFGLYALALAFLSARTVVGAFDPSDPFVVTALQLESVAYADVAVPLAVLLVCLLDLYLIGVATDGGEPMDENPSNR
ncbi:hypothetical protein [Halostagnicola kamekurae]|uniref:Uncharacterized protein n=1 Tax=Halostagnicola kamekurae TaxID=619731 RepID=A0A1I6PZC5_9EURY|nr:hypothetical protein [Halostagnicola kamekurae]SFS45524.1 hypothetical protein SAMN04488556_0883 [Halostagnicola kamekurae]